MALSRSPGHSVSAVHRRIGGSVAALFVTALVAAILGSIAISPAHAATGTQDATTPDVSGEYTRAAEPTRLLDTRDGTGRGGVVAPLGGGQTLVLSVLGKAGVPAAGVSVVALNVTVTNPSDASFLTAWPSGSARPTSSVSNFVAGQTRANLIMIGVGPGGSVAFYNRFGTVDVIADLAGWFSSTDGAPGSVFHSVPAARIVDTRSGDGYSGPIAGGQVVHVDVTGVGGVPATGVTDVLVNVTTPAPTAPGYITMFASGKLPGASTLNPDPSRDVSNLALVHVADDGTISVFAFGAPTNLVVDVVGYFDTADSVTASGFSPIVPQRAFDTRSEFVAASAVTPILRQLVVSPDVTPDSVAAVIAGITVTEPTSAGYVSVFPAGAPWPGNSNVNFNRGDTIPNLIASGVDQSRRAAIRLSAGAASVLADVYGYFVLRNLDANGGRTSPTVPLPPVTTTQPPVTTTKPPVTTTQPPVTTTQPPVTTTKPPVTTTQPPVTTTQPPVTTTQPPVTTTQPPVTTTQPPVTTTPPPVATTRPPVVNLVNVKSFGAVCDGTTNDTAAVQAAANSAVGKTLYFPAGTCRVVSVAVPSGENVTGDGPSSVIKQLAFTTFNDPSPVFDAGSNVTISNIKIDGNRAQNQPDRWSDSYNDSGTGFKGTVCCGRGRGYRAGIRGESISGLTVDKVEITGVVGAAVTTNNSSNVTLSNSNIHDTDFEAAFIYGDGYPVKAISGTNINITNNTIANLHAPAAAGNTLNSGGTLGSGVQPDGIVISRAIGGSVSGNTLNGVDRDFLKLESVQNFIVSNNSATTGRIGYPAMQISPVTNRHDLPSTNIRVTGNHFTGPGFFNGVQINSDDTLTSVVKNIEVDHNTITSVGSMSFGVLADGNTGLDTISIHDNTIVGTSRFAIYINGGGTGLTIQNNTHGGVPMSNVSTPGTFSDYLLN